MVLVYPLPVLDYHPLRQPITTATRQKLLPRIRLFWVLILLHFVSSVLYILTNPRFGIDSMLVPLPPLWGVYAGCSMAPIQFLVLFFLGVPVNAYVGLRFVVSIQKPSYGFAVPELTHSSIDASAQMKSAMVRHPPSSSGSPSSSSTVPSSASPSVKSLSGENSNSRNGAAPTKVPPQIDKSRNTKTKQVRKSFTELKHSEKVHLFNDVVYCGVGMAYCSIAMYLYHMGGDAAIEELRNPLGVGINSMEYGSVSGAAVAMHTNPLFTQPTTLLQEPPPLWPFLGIGEKLGGCENNNTPSN